MSFDDTGRGRYSDYSGYQGQPRGGYGGSPTTDRKTNVTNNLMQVSNNITSLQKLTNQIGTSRDSAQMREQLNKLVSDTRDIAAQTAQVLKRWDDKDTDARLQKGKLMKEYQLLLQQFSDIAKYSAEKERSNPLLKTAPRQPQTDLMSFGNSSESLGILGGQPANNHGYSASSDTEFFQRQQQIEFQNVQIEDRNESIKELEKSVVEINELFIDVARLVKESQPMIDSIESNVENSLVATEKGVSELRQASNYQRSSRGKLCFLLLLLLVIGAVVVVVVWFVVRK